MNINYEYVNQIVKKLPISYYIGRPVKVELDPSSESSFYSISKDYISISYSQVAESLKRLRIRSTNNDKLEFVVRTLVYHELSHAMLTPKKLTPTSINNIVEDERIERLTKDYYMNVDFDQVKKALLSKTDKSTPIGSFLRFVRLGEADDKWLNKLDELIENHKKLTFDSDNSSYYWRESNSYESDISDLFRRYCQDQGFEYNEYSDYTYNQGFKSSLEDIMDEIFGNGNSKDSDGESDNSNSDTEDSDNKINESKSDGSSSESSDNSEEEVEAVTVDHTESDKVIDLDELVTLERVAALGVRDKVENDAFERINEACSQYIDQDLINEFTRIFNSAKKVRKSNSSAINAYSGVFDPRSTIRDDYKFFLQKNRNGNRSAYSKIHLNLFLDRSGSFCNNQLIANQIIYALGKCEKMNPDFSWTLITMGDGERIEESNDIVFIAHGGNDLDKEIFDIFKKVQLRNAINYNVVLFDGIATYRGRESNFGAFNTPNTVMISDPDNKTAIEEYCTSARKIITKNYTEELKSNLIKLLGVMMR